MPAEPLVFIVIVNWNGQDVTLECLESLSRVAYTNCKIVVIDNASTDGSVQAIRKTFTDIVLLEMQNNLRFAGGNNVGIKYAVEHKADLILLLNNDTTVDKDFLTWMVARIQSDPRIGMVAPKIYYYDDPNRIWSAGGTISMWNGTMRHIGIRELDNGHYDTSCEIEYASGCCLLTKRSVVEKIGMLDESFPMYAEDADWSMRSRRAGYLIFYEPKAKVRHKLSVSTGGHLSWYKIRNKFTGNFRFFSRYAAWYQWLVFPWMNVVVNLWRALKYLRFRQNYQ